MIDDELLPVFDRRTTASALDRDRLGAEPLLPRRPTSSSTTRPSSTAVRD